MRLTAAPKWASLVVGVAVFLVGTCALMFLPFGSTMFQMVMVRLLLALCLFAVLGALGGWDMFKPSGKGVGFCLRQSWYLLAIVGAMAAIDLISYL